MEKDLYVEALRLHPDMSHDGEYVFPFGRELKQMWDDGGIVIGQFNFFVPFTDAEFEQFFSLCDRFDKAVEEYHRAQALRPSSQVLTWEERGRDSLALEKIQDKAFLGVNDVREAVRDFRNAVLERFKASKK